LAAALACPDGLWAAANRTGKFSPNRKFLLVVRRADVRSASNPSGTITREMVDATLVWLEQALEVFTGPAGESAGGIGKLAMRQPRSRRYREALLVGIYEFPDTHRRGFTRYGDGRIRLNLRLYRRYWPDQKEQIASVAAHELFHTIQYAYCGEEGSFLKEATATWAMDYAVPQARVGLRREFRFIRYPWFSLHDERRDTAGDLITRYGRPYGSAVFFRFLASQYGPEAIPKVWTECANVAGANELAAISKVVGGGAVLDDPFRAACDRFVVGCLLHRHAPADCAVWGPAEAGWMAWALGRLAASGAAQRYQDLRQSWQGHYATAFRDPQTAAMKMDFSSPAQIDSGWIAGLGTRFFLLAPPAGLPAGVGLDVLVLGGERELSVQAAVKDGEGRWRTVGGGYDTAAGCHRLRIEPFAPSDKAAVIAVTRYDPGHDRKCFPLRIAAAEPAVLTGLKLIQDGKRLLESKWSEQRNSAGRVVARTVDRRSDARLATGGKAASIELVFSRPVEPVGGGALCELDGQAIAGLATSDGGRTWRGEIPPDLIKPDTPSHKLAIKAQHRQGGSQAVLPLDGMGETIATIVPTDWVGYERDPGGMVLAVPGMGAPRGYTAKVTSMIASNPMDVFINGKKAAVGMTFEIGKDGKVTFRARYTGGQVRSYTPDPKTSQVLAKDEHQLKVLADPRMVLPEPYEFATVRMVSEYHYTVAQEEYRWRASAEMGTSRLGGAAGGVTKDDVCEFTFSPAALARGGIGLDVTCAYREATTGKSIDRQDNKVVNEWASQGKVGYPNVSIGIEVTPKNGS
jgi:hypothetical protein